MSEANCSLIIPDVEGLAPQQITVGRHFNFDCNADEKSDVGFSNFNFPKAQIVTDENAKYEFNLVQATKNDHGFNLDLVSYVTGEIKTKELQLSDSVNQIVLHIDGIKVDSILKPISESDKKTEDGTVKKQEPYGYIVSSLRWPVGYTVFFVILFLVTAALSIWLNRRRRRIKKLIAELKDYNSALAPDSQFYKHIRLLEAKNYPIKEIEKQFRIYVIRRYQVPLQGLTLNEAIIFFKNKWPTLINERRDLKNILLDLSKLSAKLSLKEDIQETKKYLNKIYNFVDHTEELVNKNIVGDQI